MNYFNRTYNVELESDEIADSLIPKKPEYDYENDKSYNERCREWEKIMEDFSLCFNNILDQILIQLDGRTFADRALDEIIEKAFQTL